MNEAGKNIIQQLFDETSLSNITRRDIESIASRYPYFGPAQFLLAKKLRETNSNGNEEQLQKAALYFTNPYWLNYLISEEDITEELTDTIVASPAPENIEEEILQEKAEPEFVQQPDSVIQPIITDNSELKDEEIIVTEEEVSQEETEPESIITEPEFVQEPDSVTQPIIADTSELKDEGIIVTEEEIIQEETEPESIITEPEFVQEPDSVAQPIIAGTSELVNEEIPVTQEISSVGVNDTPPAIAESIPGTTEPIYTETDEDDLPIPDDEIDPVEGDTQRVKLSSLIERHLSEFKKPVEENQELPVKASPYHTIDYFASQGIRADGQDKFSSRVRKFTDWLKQMKGANALQPTDLGTDAETEHIIETIAQSSNETKDIVTEAMAEVLVKQGKTEKAIQLYKKLSFLNPAKSTYFAAKIEALNNK